ncbi:hypothetical protein CF386_08740 [Paraphotobacterium marinum]|uniref:SPOR domain-containing protein n=1 Tax=Paraphotobacterium marinum TaxID=1755811 RepID=A0A220VFY7_9GAMM|nr:hypothetical protein [Paraphotobacterium marinum]ASK79146.1 hypothetical protein CF386_08740 [Paraphotobacterium marinum]
MKVFNLNILFCCLTLIFSNSVFSSGVAIKLIKTKSMYQDYSVKSEYLMTDYETKLQAQNFLKQKSKIALTNQLGTYVIQRETVKNTAYKKAIEVLSLAHIQIIQDKYTLKTVRFKNKDRILMMAQFVLRVHVDKIKQQLSIVKKNETMLRKLQQLQNKNKRLRNQLLKQSKKQMTPQEVRTQHNLIRDLNLNEKDVVFLFNKNEIYRQAVPKIEVFVGAVKEWLAILKEMEQSYTVEAVADDYEVLEVRSSNLALIYRDNMHQFNRTFRAEYTPKDRAVMNTTLYEISMKFKTRMDSRIQDRMIRFFKKYGIKYNTFDQREFDKNSTKYGIGFRFKRNVNSVLANKIIDVIEKNSLLFAFELCHSDLDQQYQFVIDQILESPDKLTFYFEYNRTRTVNFIVSKLHVKNVGSIKQSVFRTHQYHLHTYKDQLSDYPSYIIHNRSKKVHSLCSKDDVLTVLQR